MSSIHGDSINFQMSSPSSDVKCAFGPQQGGFNSLVRTRRYGIGQGQDLKDFCHECADLYRLGG